MIRDSVGGVPIVYGRNSSPESAYDDGVAPYSYVGPYNIRVLSYY